MYGFKLSEEQRNFVPWFMSQKSRVCILTGHAGSGKTTTMKELDMACPTGVVWCAPSHQAKNILANHIMNGVVTTMASALGLRKIINYKTGRETFLPRGRSVLDDLSTRIAIFDEASMIKKNELDWILEKNVQKILFIGDPAQIPPIDESESPVFELNVPTYSLTEIFRQTKNSDVLSFATHIRETGNGQYEQCGISRIDVNEDKIMEFFKRYPEGVAVCPTNDERDMVNIAARKQLLNNIQFDLVDVGKNPFLNGERLILDSPVKPPHGPKNSELVTISSDPKEIIFQGYRLWEMKITDISGHEYNIKIPHDYNEVQAVRSDLRKLSKQYNETENENKKKSLEREMDIMLNEITYASPGYGITIHKSQGSTFKNVLFLTGGMKFFNKFPKQKQRMGYTAVSRASERVILCN